MTGPLSKKTIEIFPDIREYLAFIVLIGRQICGQYSTGLLRRIHAQDRNGSIP